MDKSTRKRHTRTNGHVGIYLGVALVRDVDTIAKAFNLTFSAAVRRHLAPSVLVEIELARTLRKSPRTITVT